MAKPMRVCDRNIVERVICKKYEETKKDMFKKQYESSSAKVVIDKMLHSLEDYQLDLKILNNKILDMQIELEETIDFYNGEYAGEKTYGSSYDDSYLAYNRYNASIVDIFFDFPRKVKIGIQDEIGLTTMGGDFDANELIAQLTKQFVK